MPDPGQRWLNLLNVMLAEAFPAVGWQVVNAGRGGNSAREAMQRFERDVLAHDPDFVLLEFGGNNNDPNRPERRVSLEEFDGHLADFKARLPSKTRIVVITFPPLIEEQHCYCGHPYFQNTGGAAALLEQYREATRAFAARWGLPLVDLDRELRRRMPGFPRNHFTFDDGVHLTAAGNQVLAELVFAALRPLLCLD